MDLNKVPEHGIFKQKGSGIPRIIDRVMAAGLREPEFIDGDVDLRINIYRKQNDTNGDNVTKGVTIETNEAKVIDLIISNPTITQTKSLLFILKSCTCLE
jgi:predicted HTH transcriptional regulator